MIMKKLKRNGFRVMWAIQADPKSKFDERYLLDTEWLLEPDEAYFPLIHDPAPSGAVELKGEVRFMAHVALNDEMLKPLGIRLGGSPYLVDLKPPKVDDLDTFLQEMNFI